MKELIVSKVKMRGFKNHKDSVEYLLGPKTTIVGENGQGKTTVGEAITWCLLNCDLTGNERATTRLTNNGSKMVEVEIDFSFEGKEHNLIRRKKGSKTDIYLDGTKVKNEDLIEFYKDKDTFLSIFSPDYFPSLSPKNAKEFMHSILTEVRNEEVFESMDDYSEKLLIDNDFRNSNLFLEDKREELKELDKDDIHLEGVISAKKEDIEIPEVMNFDDTELKQLKSKVKEIKDRPIELPHDIREISKRKSQLEKEIWEVSNSNIEEPQYKDISQLEVQRNSLADEYKRLRKELNDSDNKIVCPECSTEIDLDQYRKENIKIRIKEVEFQGKEIKKEIKATEIENKKLKEDYLKKAEEHRKAKEEKLDKLRRELESLDFDKLDKENTYYQNEIKMEREQKCKELENRIEVLEEERNKVQSNNSNREQLLKLKAKYKEDIKKAEEEIEKNKVKKGNIEQQIDAAKQFNSIKLEMQSKNINKHLDKVTIKLQKLVKSTGEIKSDFKIEYDGREFTVLSNSERIRAGLEIANLIMNEVGVRFPVFVDNAESITSYKEPITQTIEARVMEGQNLKVEVA